MKTSLLLAALSSLTFAVAACGGPEPATPATPGATPPAPGTPATPPGPAAGLPTEWSDSMPMDQQVAFMKTNVLPRMSKTFQAHNATRYADMTCKTCHGPNNKPPKEFLPKLSMKDGKITAFAEKPEVSKFMAEKVVPEMASAMGKKPYDPATHQGFGCAGCHTVEMK
ncbi:MAG: hypothetical protein JST00_00450 [Deltaproteobacteria bacterium]|nr:hypothetical protein [Deltaproteobacteria bacterium]